MAWVALGANIGHRATALRRLREELARSPVTLDAASPELLTRAVGVRAQPDFLNQVVRLRSPSVLSGPAWLERLQAAERAAGRRPTYRWGPRRADADLLLLGEDGAVRLDLPHLRVPHPALADRPFLSGLLAAIDPGLVHPDGWRFADRAGRFAPRPPSPSPTPPPP